MQAVEYFQRASALNSGVVELSDDTFSRYLLSGRRREFDMLILLTATMDDPDTTDMFTEIRKEFSRLALAVRKKFKDGSKVGSTVALCLFTPE
jgi:hypothetical protein